MFEMKKREATATMACKVSKAEIYEKATFSREIITHANSEGSDTFRYVKC